MSSFPKLIAILGPTASGKTKLAIQLAKQFNGEIISADSRQIYQYMDIGTAKDINQYDSITYHLIDILNPNQQFTVAEYQQLAIKKIKAINKKNKLPFLVGGTGLYISAVIDNFKIPAVAPNPSLRQKITRMSQQEKIGYLKKIDPLALKIIDINNPRRLNRAVEVCLSGQKFSQLRQTGTPLFNVLQLGIKLPAEQLKNKINRRVDKMIKQGLVAETQRLIKQYGPTDILTNTLGYSEIIDYLNKKISLPQAVELIKLHTRQYVKRQMTWFKRDQRIHWINGYQQAAKHTKNFLQQ